MTVKFVREALTEVAVLWFLAEAVTAEVPAVRQYFRTSERGSKIRM